MAIGLPLLVVWREVLGKPRSLKQISPSLILRCITAEHLRAAWTDIMTSGPGNAIRISSPFRGNPSTYITESLKMSQCFAIFPQPFCIMESEHFRTWSNREGLFGKKYFITVQSALSLPMDYKLWASGRDNIVTVLNLGLRPANETHRYRVTPSLFGWAQT